jgi:hypothetical protein
VTDKDDHLYPYTNVKSGIQCRSSQNYKIGFSFLSPKYIDVRNKSKNWFAQIQDTVSEWRDMSTTEFYFSEHPTKRVGLVQDRRHHLLMEM